MTSNHGNDVHIYESVCSRMLGDEVFGYCYTFLASMLLVYR